MGQTGKLRAQSRPRSSPSGPSSKHRVDGRQFGIAGSEAHAVAEAVDRGTAKEGCRQSVGPAPHPDLPPIFSQRASSPMTIERSADLHMS